jgi:chemotaxis protein CheX
VTIDVTFINAFLASLLNILQTMAQTEAKHAKPVIKKDNIARGDVTGIIGMVGNKVIGSMSVTFSERAIIEITSRMLGEEIKQVDDTVKDMVGEITNMVTGGAKKILDDAGHDFNMATPTVVTGKNHEICHKAQDKVIHIPFESDAGPFYVEVSFDNVK